jgi:anhydro-N-acetylmuramic acid kinase
LSDKLIDAMNAHSRYVAGAMSGTSADGVDIAIVAIDGRGYDMTARLIVHHHRPYNAELRRQIFAFRSGEAGSVSHSTLRELAQLGREISLTYAAAVNEALAAAHLESKNLAAVAAHGQTLFHEPPNTIQWLDPALLAAEVGCAVVSDFRRADLAAGGQGAPLVPFADYILFRDPTKNRVLLNLGGIANITWLPAGATPDQVIAFDTGPGNCISDWLMRQLNPAGSPFDTAGEMATRGSPIPKIARAFVADGFFSKPPPKSTDGPQMIHIFERAMGHLADHPPEDLLATASMLVGATLRLGIGQFDPAHKVQKSLIISGGGTKNAAMMRWIELEQPKDQIFTVDHLGVPSDAKEAIAFALLGAATLDGMPSNVPSVTGAKRPVVLGSITPPP